MFQHKSNDNIQVIWMDNFNASPLMNGVDKSQNAIASGQQIVWIVTGIFVAIAVMASLYLIRGHLKHFTQPIVQSKVIGILWMVPIYATDSWLSLRFKNAALYLDLLRDSYEGYVIYLFLALMVAYLGHGNNEKVLRILETLPPLQHPWPFHYLWDPIPMNETFLKDCKMATMQFALLKPLMALVAICLQVQGIYNQGSFSPTSGYLYTAIILNCSISYAFYYLVLFYLALRVVLTPYNPVPKFLCIKAVLFLSFWQSVILAFLSRFEIIHDWGEWSVENVVTGIQNVLICIEMSGVALAHHQAFPFEPYMDPSGLTSNTFRRSFMADHLGMDEAMRDFNEVMPIVVPTNFKPVGKSISSKKMKKAYIPELLSKESREAEEKGLLSLSDEETTDHNKRGLDNVHNADVYQSSGASEDSEAKNRGWRL